MTFLDVSIELDDQQRWAVALELAWTETPAARGSSGSRALLMLAADDAERLAILLAGRAVQQRRSEAAG